MENETRYIVVVFYQGIGYTYQTNGEVHIFFHKPARAYKKLAYAKLMAEMLGCRYAVEKACVFKVELNERLSCDQYNKWCKDENRLMYEFKYNHYGEE